MRTPACLLRIRQASTGPAGRSDIIDRIAIARIFGRVAGLLLTFVALQPGLALAQTINQEAKLFPPLTAGAGTSVSISGDTAVVGAPGDGGKGAVYVFVRDNLTNTWAPQQTLTASDGVAGDLFGHAVSISGNNIAVGAAGRNSNTGAVYGFNRSGTTWTQGPILTTGPAGSKLGYSVAVQGLTLIVGAPYTTIGAKTNVGNAYAYTSLDGGLTWQQQFVLQVVTGQAKSGDHIGWSVSLSGNTALVGAPDDDFGNKAQAGSTYVFVRNGTTWTRQTRLNPGPAVNARFGTGVALFANAAVIGSDGRNNGTGTAFVYSRSGTTWSLLGTLTASDGVAGDNFGASVAVSGLGLALVGAPHANATGAVSGKAYLFGPVGGVFQQLDALIASDNAAGDNFGASASLDAGHALVGAPAQTAGNGAGYVFLVAPPTMTTITGITPEPSVTGQSYAVSVQVTTNPAGSGIPTGSVTVSDGIGSTCTITLDNTGAGTCSLASSSAGSLTISASYGGTIIFGASSGTATHQVNKAATTTAITQDFPDPSLVGQTVTVTVSVTPVVPGAGTPTGLVTITDDVDLAATCTIPNISLANSCTLSLNTLGTSNLTATYAGDAGFDASVSVSEPHTVTIPAGNHLVFVPPSPSDVLRGNRLNGVTVQIQDAGNAVVTTENSTQVTLSVSACGGTQVLFGPVTVTAGVADFTGVGPRFYTLASLTLNADAAGYTTAASGSFNVLANADIVFADDFTSCRL